jgi:hypothetical protein
MHSLSKFLLLLGTLLCFGQLLGAIPTVVGRTLIKARAGGDGTRPDPGFNVTRSVDVLRLPAGFNFENPAVNITREDFGGMTSFADSEIEKIPGAIMDHNVVIIETVHCWTPPLIISNDAFDAKDAPKAAPKVSDITPIINKLNKLGNDWCCQKEADNCTKLGSYGEAASDICEVNEKPKPSQQACLRCNDAGSKVWKIQWLCEDIYTNTASGYVRYVCSGRSWVR